MTAATLRTWDMKALWWGILAAPAAWSLDELASLYVHESACNPFPSTRTLGLPATTVTLAAIGVRLAAVAASAVVIAWRARADLGQDTGDGATAPDQRRFMAHAGVILSGLFLFGILLRLLTTFIIPPCRYL
jgi:hypothetical protein